MSQHYLRYWQYKNAKPFLTSKNKPITWTAGGQYNRVEVGDEIWFVTSPIRSSKLYLIGHLTVGWRGSRKEAIQILGTSDIWEAPWVVIAEVDTEEHGNLIDITDLIPELRFQSNRDRLKLIRFTDQLQSMRRLTAKSAKLLEFRWKEG
jgi:hypothetical protein